MHGIEVRNGQRLLYTGCMFSETALVRCFSIMLHPACVDGDNCFSTALPHLAGHMALLADGRESTER